MNPVGLLYSANVTYEKPISDSGSVIVRFRYYHQRLNFNVNQNEVFAISKGTKGIKLGYRFYLSKNSAAPNGFYISPNIDLMFRNKDYDAYGNLIAEKSNYYGLGVHTGKQWIWGKFAFDIYGGADLFLTPNSPVAILPVGGLSLGFALE